MVAKKKVGKKSVPKKKPVVKKGVKKKVVKTRSVAKPVKKAAKKKLVKKAASIKKATKRPKPAKKATKKAATKPVAKKKVAAKKAATRPVAKKKPVVKKAAARPAAKKKVAAKKPAPVKSAPQKKATAKIVKKSLPPEKTGKAQIQAMKSKVFRRSSTEVQPFQPYRVEHGEEYMNTDQREHFRNILMEWKKLLMEEVDRTVHHMQDEAANFPDPNDRATQEEEFALELRTRDRERKLIRKIDEAVISLETGDYGYCEVCGVEIGVKRLEARPTATLCIDCKTLDEIKEKQLG